MDHPNCAIGLLWGHFVPGGLWPQFNEKTSRERKKKTNMGAGGEKKRAKCWAVRRTEGRGFGRGGPVEEGSSGGNEKKKSKKKKMTMKKKEKNQKNQKITKNGKMKKMQKKKKKKIF